MELSQLENLMRQRSFSARDIQTKYTITNLIPLQSSLALLVDVFVPGVLLVDAAGDPWKHCGRLHTLVVHATLKDVTLITNVTSDGGCPMTSLPFGHSLQLYPWNASLSQL